MKYLVHAFRCKIPSMITKLERLKYPRTPNYVCDDGMALAAVLARKIREGKITPSELLDKATNLKNISMKEENPIDSEIGKEAAFIAAAVAFHASHGKLERLVDKRGMVLNGRSYGNPTKPKENEVNSWFVQNYSDALGI